MLGSAFENKHNGKQCSVPILVSLLVSESVSVLQSVSSPVSLLVILNRESSVGGSGANSERRQSSFEEPASGKRVDPNIVDDFMTAIMINMVLILIIVVLTTHHHNLNQNFNED